MTGIKVEAEAVEMLSGAEIELDPRRLSIEGVKQVFGYHGGAVAVFMMRYIPLEDRSYCWCVMSRPRCIWRMAARAWRHVGVVLW